MTLNARIAKVKGWRQWIKPEKGDYCLDEFPMFAEWKGCEWIDFYPRHGSPEKQYNWSGSIADAWELVEEMGPGVPRCLMWMRHQGQWQCQLGDECQVGPSPEAAICLAYLAVMEGEDA